MKMSIKYVFTSEVQWWIQRGHPDPKISWGGGGCKNVINMYSCVEQELELGILG